MKPSRASEIRRLRDAKRWTRADLARESGVSERTIARLEGGGPAQRRTTIDALMAALTRPMEGHGVASAVQSAAGGRLGIEDHLGAILAHIKTLEGAARSEFIRAVTSLLTALEHARPRASSGQTPNDDR